MNLGPIQTLWLTSLKEHPERQGSGVLGKKIDKKGNYQACCLGEYLICYRKYKGIENIFGLDSFNEPSRVYLYDNSENTISDENTNSHTLGYSYQLLGLYSSLGQILLNKVTNDEDKELCQHISPNKNETSLFHSLAILNDRGIPWPRIAKLIERNPDAVFYKAI